MRKILMPLLAVFLLAAIGCEKEENADGGSENCILQQISFRIPDGSAGYDIDFAYDSQERLTSIVRTEFDIGDPYINSYNIEYGNEGVNKITSTSSLSNSGQRYNFFYSAGRIDSVAISLIPDDDYWSRRYIKVHYQADKVSRLDFYNNSLYDGGYILNRQMDIVWEGENVAQMGDWKYTYDDKKSALRHVGMAFTDYETMAMLSKNNVVTVQYGSGNPGQRVYTYNEYGYPVTMDDGFNATLVEYDYTCK